MALPPNEVAEERDDAPMLEFQAPFCLVATRRGDSLFDEVRHHREPLLGDQTRQAPQLFT
jgi:hypothetical protein